MVLCFLQPSCSKGNRPGGQPLPGSLLEMQTLRLRQLESSAKCHVAMETMSTLPDTRSWANTKTQGATAAQPYANCPVMRRNTSHSITPWLPHVATHSSHQAGVGSLGCEILGQCEVELFNRPANICTHTERMFHTTGVCSLQVANQFLIPSFPQHTHHLYQHVRLRRCQ